MVRRLIVGVDIRDLRIARTGARTYLEELLHQFKTAGRPDINFKFYDTPFPVYTGQNKVWKLVEHVRFFLWKQLILPLLALKDGCNVLFCTDYFLPYVRLGYQTVTVFHDAFFYEYPHHYNRIWLSLFKTIGISSARRAFAVVTPTLYTKERIIHFTNIPEDKVRVIYEGPKSLPVKDKGKSPVEAPYLLHVGTMEIRKNMVNLLKAFLDIKKTKPEFKLVLIGQFSPKSTIDDRKAILDFIAENHLQDDVIFPGYVSDEELYSYYSHAFAYVFPSVNEGFGIPILEAFAAGTPVLVADNTCLPEVGGDAVLTFDPYRPEQIAQRMIELLEDPDLRKQLIISGKERLKEFNWEKAARELYQLFIEAAK